MKMPSIWDSLNNKNIQIVSHVVYYYCVVVVVYLSVFR